MVNVYFNQAFGFDTRLGRVEANGKVYERRPGPDKYLGRVDLRSGKIYETRFGPDRYLGWVDKDTGRVYLPRIGPDYFLGRVEGNGKLYLNRMIGMDKLLGRITGMPSRMHGGAALLLLVWPHYQAMQMAAGGGEDFEIHVKTF